MKSIVVLGAGESGTGAALLAAQQGYCVFVSDSGPIASTYREFLESNNIPFEENQHTWEKIKETEEIIKSPGIPNHASIIKCIQKAGIPIIDEIDFASRYTKAKLIGITGSNGKTTVTHFVYHVLHQAGLDVGIAGNMGESFAKKLWKNEDHAYYVLELSSFQLEYIRDCRFHIACLLNITPDHLDRYDYKLDEYIAAKQQITSNMTADDFLIYNHDDMYVKACISRFSTVHQPHKCPISVKHAMYNGAYSSKSTIYFSGNKTCFELPIDAIPLQGSHNMLNAMAVGLVAMYLNVASEAIIHGLNTFRGLAHRIELVADLNGIKFYNDSKATNIAATLAALQSFEHPIIWIAGGYDKGNDYNPLHLIVQKSVTTLILLGKDNAPIEKAFSHLNIPIYEAKSMQEAVELAYQKAQPGYIILLSPACASFDLFKNFEDRGQQFKDVVKNLNIAVK